MPLGVLRRTLNRIQSAIFSAAFTSNQNLLVCAPTGAGKTNIAMVAVLREISSHMDAQGVIDKDKFKVVYVAPMKALAAEVTAAFSRRLAPLGKEAAVADAACAEVWQVVLAVPGASVKMVPLCYVFGCQQYEMARDCSPV